MGGELIFFGHKESVRDQSFFIVNIYFVKYSLLSAKQNKQFVFLQWVRTNRQTKNKKEHVKICNLLYLKALIGKVTIDIDKNNYQFVSISMLMMMSLFYDT